MLYAREPFALIKVFAIMDATAGRLVVKAWIGRYVRRERLRRRLCGEYGIGDLSRMAMHRLANPVALCDGWGVFFVAADGQIRIRMAVKILVGVWQGYPAPRGHAGV